MLEIWAGRNVFLMLARLCFMGFIRKMKNCSDAKMPFEGKSDFFLKLHEPNSESNLSFPPRKACCHRETFS